MKKLVALLIALILGLFSIIPAGADVTVDRPTNTKTYEWFVGYHSRCNSYKTYRVRKNHGKKLRHVAKRVLLAPLSLFIGTACADGYTFDDKKVYFTRDEMAKHIAERTQANAQASRFLGNPAMKSAMVFSKGIMAADKMLIKHHAGDLGGKYLFEAIFERKQKMDEAKKRLAEVRDLLAQDEKNVTLFAEKRSLEKERQLLKAEVKVLNTAVRELMKDATDQDKAMMMAQSEAAAARYRNHKEKAVVGRQINAVPKPILKSYKVMYFMEKEWMKTFEKQIVKVNKLAQKRANMDLDEEKTDDDRRKAEKELKDAFNALKADVDAYRASGKRIHLDARFAKIHNARQSQLTDVIGVYYGKTTDMIISLSHNIANIFNKSVCEYLDDSHPDESIQSLMEAVVDIATTNGFELETMPKNGGNSRLIRYKFWNANNSQLKIGKCVALSEAGAYQKAAECGRAGMTELEFEEVNTNGSDMLKWWSYASTPGAPLSYRDKDGNEHVLTCNDVLVVKSIDAVRKFKNVLVYKEDGTCERMSVKEIKRAAFDGMLLFMIPIPSQQIRGGFAFKGFGVCCAYDDGTTMVDEIANREGWDIPEYIEDVDGVMRRWRDYKVICTEDAWKWAGWKFGEEKRQFTYAEYCARMNKLAEKYPTVNQLYTARIADATEESKRRMTRQSNQQFLPATQEDIAELTAKSIKKIMKLTTHEGVLRKMAGLDKPEEERTAFEHLIEACPELLNDALMKRAIEDMFNRQVAEAAVRPEVDGIYPYIAEDPVAMLKIVIWGKSPDERGLGYLTSSQVNIPGEEEGTELYIVRYPNNYLCGQLRRNHNDDIYRCVGNVMILSLDGGVLIIADGDTDGDEMCVVKNPVVIKMMAEAKRLINPPVIDFPHSKMKKQIFRGEDRAHELSRSIVVANKYGPAVGQNSNMATKFFHKASVAYQEWKATGNKKAEWKMRKSLDNAILAHIAAIVAIDLAKTGEMPAWLQSNLDEISKFAGSKMPWNQRFCKDSKATPWFSEVWDDITNSETKDVVDRIARHVVNATNATGYVAPVGNNFNKEHDLLCDKMRVFRKDVCAKLSKKDFFALEARNYRSKNENSEGDDEFKFVEKLKSGEEVSRGELARFLWRNQASLVYVLQKGDTDKLDNARMQNQYFDFCRNLMLNFGVEECSDQNWNKRTTEEKQLSNVYKFVELAFKDNGIGQKALSKEEKESKKASFALFIVKALAYDLYNMACDKKGIEDRWMKPVESDSTDEVDCGVGEEYECCEYGYSDYNSYDYCEGAECA